MACVSCPNLTTLSLTNLELSLTEDESMTPGTESALMRHLGIVSFVDIQNEIQFHNLLKIFSHFCSQITAMELTKCNVTISDKKVDSPQANGSSQFVITTLEKLTLSSCKQNVSLLSLLQLACVSCPYLTSLSLTDLQLSLTEDGIYQVTREPESALACDSMPQLRRVSLADIQNEIQFHYLLKILSHFCSQITALELTKCNVTISDKKVDSPQASGSSQFVITSLERLTLSSCKQDVSLVSLLERYTCQL